MSEERERRYVAEYCAATFPGGNFQLNVPLGPLNERLVQAQGIDRAAAALRPFRRRIDAVAWGDPTYILIETKIRDPLEGLGRLQTYRDLAAETPDLPNYAGQPLEMRLVVPQSLDWVILSAKKAGINLVVFWQDWIAQYTLDRNLYFTREYREARARKLEARKILDLD